jgi:hypothetical protein
LRLWEDAQLLELGVVPWQWDILTCPLQSSRGLFSNP